MTPIKTNQQLILDEDNNPIIIPYAIEFIANFKEYIKGTVLLCDKNKAVKYTEIGVAKVLNQEEYDSYIKLMEQKSKELKTAANVKLPKEDKHKKKYQSSFIHNDKLYEQCKNGNFVSLDEKKEAIYIPFLFTSEEEVIMPCEGDELLGADPVIILPEKPEQYGDMLNLVNEIKVFIHQHLEVSSEFELFATWYILLTWVYDQVPTINYLSVMGDTGTGKSRFLDIIGKLCYKPMIGSGGVTIAAVKRVVNKWRGTLLIDEGDFKESDETQELIKFINLGFERGKKLFNCDKNDPTKIEFFDPYCPKVITRRRQFTDQATEARCLTEVMRMTTRKDIIPVITDKIKADQMKLRNKLLQFRFDYWNKINLDKALAVDIGNVEPRIKQATLAFLTLISQSNEAFEQFKAFLIYYNNKIIDERSQSYDGVIVNHIIDFILDNGKFDISSKDIENVMRNDNHKITASTIGKHLSQLKIETKQTRTEFGKVKRLIQFNNQFLEVCKRYCSDVARIQDLAVAVCNSVADVALVVSTHPSCDKNQSLNNHTSSNTPATSATLLQTEHDLASVWQDLQNYQKNNVLILDGKYGQLIEILKRQGTIMESPKGTYLWIDPPPKTAQEEEVL